VSPTRGPVERKVDEEQLQHRENEVSLHLTKARVNKGAHLLMASRTVHARESEE